MKYTIIIGLEVHVELKTASKLFCGCATTFGSEPNTQTCPVCLGFPGTLPVINRKAIEYAIKTGLALGCAIPARSKFDRKNYYYPDLPKAYQISQYDQPLAEHGVLGFESDGTVKRVGITRVHLEEDAGKLVHAGGAGQIGSSTYSLVDYNRGGVPLMEIVSGPDIRSPQEAFDYLTQLKRLLEYLQVSDCNMEEGSLRCDANISLMPEGQSEFNPKVEIKNMNSFKNVKDALTHEVERQTKVFDGGGMTSVETRLWDANRGISEAMRSKEAAHDYRYFPEPDLVPIAISEEWLAEIRAGMPEFPEARKQRFVTEHKLPAYDAGVLTADRAMADYFEAAVKSGAAPKETSNWIMTELLARLKEAGKGIEVSPVTPERLAGLVKLITQGVLSGPLAKQAFTEMFASGKDAETVVKEKGLSQITDTGAIEREVDAVLAANADTVAKIKAGDERPKGFLVGQVMKATKGKANPKLVNEILEKKLKD